MDERNYRNDGGQLHFTKTLAQGDDCLKAGRQLGKCKLWLLNLVCCDGRFYWLCTHHTQSFIITCRSMRLKPKFIPNLIKNQKSKPVDYTESTGFMLKILITK